MKDYHVQKLAIFNATLIVVSILFLGALELTVPLNYPDFIPGHLAWFATTKFQDLVVIPIVLVSGPLVFVFLTSLFRKLNMTDLKAAQKLAFQLVLWSLPALSTLSGVLIQRSIENEFLLISFAGVSIISFCSWLSLTQQTHIKIENISIGLLMVLFISLAPLAWSVIINIAPFSITGGGVVLADIKNWIFGFFLIGISSHIYFVSFKYDLYHRSLTKIVLISQLSLTLLFFTIYPARLMEAGSNLTTYETSILLKLFITILVLFSLGDIIYRYFKYGKGEFAYKLISPFVIIALIVAMKFGNTYRPVISPDDFHFGERLLGWWTYFQGYIPYIDFMPPHGFMRNDFAGLLNIIFYDGTAASLGESTRLAFVLFTGIAFLAIYTSTKSLLISFVSIYFLGGRVDWFFLILFAALWFNRSLIENKFKWSIVWFITAPLVILGVPPQGLLLVAASGVIPIYFLWVTLKNKDWTVMKPVVFWFLAFLIFYALTPLGEILFSAVKYLLVNGPINQVAYGVPWSHSFGKGFLFEAVRMSWVVVPAAMLFTLYFLFQNNRFYPYHVLPLIAVFIFALLLIPYTMGRIDPGHLSRPGYVGILLITGFMSLVLWNILGQFNRIWLVFGVVFLASLIRFAPISFDPLLNSAAAYINVGPLKKITTDHLLANIGRSEISEKHWQRLNKLAELLNKKLEPKESYLDLTSRNAQYFYLDRIPPIRDTSPYVMASPIQQMNAIKRLEKKLPRLALLEGNNIIHDGGGLALRNHYLYRFVIEHYEPFELNGFVIGLSKEALKRGDWGSLPIPDQSLRMELFEKAFSKKHFDFQKIPIAWGQSINSLSKKMETVLDERAFKLIATNDLQVEQEFNYTVTGRNPFIVLDLAHNQLSGQTAGMLKFDFKCASKHQEPKIQVFWWGDNQQGAFEENSIFFNAGNGTLIIPLDALPRWYLLNNIKGLRIDLHNAKVCKSFSIKNLSLNSRTLDG